LLQNPKLNGAAQALRHPEQPSRLDSLLRHEPLRRPSVCRDYWEAAPPSPLLFTALVTCRNGAAIICWVAMCVSSFYMTSSRSSVAGVWFCLRAPVSLAEHASGPSRVSYRTRLAVRLPADRIARPSLPKCQTSRPP
jgi:hypothetical protein